MVRTVVAVGLAVVLAAIGVLHFVWAFSTWPMKDAVTFTKTIGPDRLRLVGMYGLAVVLLARGLGGYFINSGAAVEFQRLNSFLYSPLCVALGALGGVVAVAASKR